MNLWAEYIDIVYKDLSTEGQIAVQNIHDTTKRDQFLMKLRFDFEGIQTNLMNRATVHSLDECLNEQARPPFMVYQRSLVVPPIQPSSLQVPFPIILWLLIQRFN